VETSLAILRLDSKGFPVTNALAYFGDDEEKQYYRIGTRACTTNPIMAVLKYFFARVFVTVSHFHPRLTFSGKEKSLPLKWSSH
jgi:hypothetical protein